MFLPAYAQKKGVSAEAETPKKYIMKILFIFVFADRSADNYLNGSVIETSFRQIVGVKCVIFAYTVRFKFAILLAGFVVNTGFNCCRAAL